MAGRSYLQCALKQTRIRARGTAEYLLDWMAAMIVLKSIFPQGIISRFQLLVAPPDAPRLIMGRLLLSSTTALVETSLSAEQEYAE